MDMFFKGFIWYIVVFIMRTHTHTHISICACVKCLFTTGVLCCLYVCFLFVSYMALNALLCKTFSSQTSRRGHVRTANLSDMNSRMLVDKTCHLIGRLCACVVLCFCVFAYFLFPRWRPPGVVWQSGWRRLWWCRLGGRERVRKSSLRGRWLHPTQNNGTCIFQSPSSILTWANCLLMNSSSVSH